MDDTLKTINIAGTHSQRQIKNLLQDSSQVTELKKRVQSEKWSFSNEHYEYENQLQMMKNIGNNQ